MDSEPSCQAPLLHRYLPHSIWTLKPHNRAYLLCRYIPPCRYPPLPPRSVFPSFYMRVLPVPLGHLFHLSKALICLLLGYPIVPLGFDASSQAVFLHRPPPYSIQTLTSFWTTAALPRCTRHLSCFVPPNGFRTNLFIKGWDNTGRKGKGGKGREGPSAPWLLGEEQTVGRHE